MVNTLVRISAILLLKRVFKTDFGVMGRIAWLLLAIAILYALAVLLETFLICHPLAVDWNAHIKGTCGDQVVSYVVLEVLGLLLDFAILVLPLPCIWKLRTGLRRKMSVAIVFSVGFL